MYESIKRLDKVLTFLGIPHEMEPLFDGFIIYAPSKSERHGDVIEHASSYGSADDLMEAYGFDCDDVDGCIDVSQALKYFLDDHLKEKYPLLYAFEATDIDHDDEEIGDFHGKWMVYVDTTKTGVSYYKNMYHPKAVAIGAEDSLINSVTKETINDRIRFITYVLADDISDAIDKGMDLLMDHISALVESVKNFDL